jgi:hypothetical protein
MSVLDQLYGDQSAAQYSSAPDVQASYPGQSVDSASSSGIDWTSFLNTGLPRSLDAITKIFKPTTQYPVLPNSANTVRYDPTTGQPYYTNAGLAGGGITLLIVIGLAFFALKD